MCVDYQLNSIPLFVRCVLLFVFIATFFFFVLVTS